jgi:FkbM family methyltransferase
MLATAEEGRQFGFGEDRTAKVSLNLMVALKRFVRFVLGEDTYNRLKRVVRYIQGKDILQRAQVSLPTEQHGSEYGRATILAHSLSPNSIVYSFGIGDDVSFDLSLIEQYNLTVHAFDPTPRSAKWIEKQRLPSRFIFYQLGVAEYDGMATFSAPENSAHMSYTMENQNEGPTEQVQASVRRLSTIMQELGHVYVDLLKLDIEGTEYSVLSDIVREDLDVGQIYVEFHHGVRSLGIEKTKHAIRLLNSCGYRIFSVDTTGVGYSFIKQE